MGACVGTSMLWFIGRRYENELTQEQLLTQVMQFKAAAASGVLAAFQFTR